jgi:maltose-binding protein MalE
MLNRRLLRGVMAGALALALLLPLAGCGSDDDGLPKVTLWHQKIGAERAFLEEVIDEYNALHTDHEVEILYRENEELRNLFVMASVGGGGPDVVFGPADNVSILAITETVRPLTDVMDEAYLAQFNDDGVVGYQDTPYMLADQVGNHLVFVYNKELLPEPPQTMSELITEMQRLTEDTDGDGRIDQYGLTWNYTEPFFFIPFLTGYGGWVMDEAGNPTLDNDATVKAIQFVLDLRDRYQVIPRESDYNVAETLFKEGRAAAVINGPWAWSGYEEAGIDYGIARIPMVDETGQWAAPVFSAKGYSVNVNVPDERLPYVQSMLRFLTEPDMQLRMAERLSTVPVIDAVRESETVRGDSLLQASLRVIDVSRPMPTAPQLRQIWDGMRGPYQLVMNGAVSAEEGAALMQQEVEKRINDTFL